MVLICFESATITNALTAQTRLLVSTSTFWPFWGSKLTYKIGGGAKGRWRAPTGSARVRIRPASSIGVKSRLPKKAGESARLAAATAAMNGTGLACANAQRNAGSSRLSFSLTKNTVSVT